MIPWLIRLYQKLANTGLGRLFLTVAFAAAFVSGLDSAAQAVQILFTGLRSGLDVKQNLTMGGLGALGGLVHWGLGPLKHLPGGKSLPATMFKSGVVET